MKRLFGRTKKLGAEQEQPTPLAGSGVVGTTRPRRDRQQSLLKEPEQGSMVACLEHKSQRGDVEPSSSYSLMKSNKSDNMPSAVNDVEAGAGGNEVTSKIPASNGLSDIFHRLRFSATSFTNATKDKVAESGTVANETVAPMQGPTSKQPTYEGFQGKMRYLATVVCGGWFVYVLLFAIMATGLAYGALNDGNFLDFVDWDKNIKVAFVGNSYFFLNDIPRLVETIADGHVYQNSVLHSGGSLGGLLVTGNGMYPRWQTNEAILDSSYKNSYGNSMTLYDYGLCTVQQMLNGSDSNVTYLNQNYAYYNDGHNPCFADQNYLTYTTNQLSQNKVNWDYVVLVDQTKRMAIESARQDTTYALAKFYAPLLKKTGAVPVVVDTHAFWSSNTNMTGLGDIPNFQKMIYNGVRDYVSVLSKHLPRKQTPIVAPIGIAYLTIYDEKPELYQQLFMDDGVHASFYGSYLLSIVIYTTVFGHLPSDQVSIPERIENLFANSRKLVYGESTAAFPSYDEAYYLRNVARRVVLGHHRPKSFQ